jgi:hypothetical protein
MLYKSAIYQLSLTNIKITSHTYCSSQVATTLVNEEVNY